MPHKRKTHKGALKRLRVTGKGKLKRNKAGKSHLNSHKTGKRLRQLRRKVLVENKLVDRYVESMGG